MDLKNYYRKIREVAATISDEWAVVSSRATPDGGHPGVLAEVPRGVAARMVAEGTAELATAEQAASFREDRCARHAAEEERRAAARIQVNVISQADASAIHHKATKVTKSTKKPS